MQIINYKICKQCHDGFNRPDYAGDKRWENLKYCGVKCSSKWNANHRDNSHLKKYNFKKGQVPFNKGKKLSREHIEEYLVGSNNSNWKDEPGYKAIHKWLNDNHPRTGTCARCKSKKKTQYACLEKKYTRKPEDYLELCVKCHAGFDRGLIKIVHFVVDN